MTTTEETIETRTTAPEPTAFGRVVLEMMRERRIADACELGLERLDLRALRRHFDGEQNRHRRWLPTNVAVALDATEPEKAKMAHGYIWAGKAVLQTTNGNTTGPGPTIVGPGPLVWACRSSATYLVRISWK